MNKLYFGYPVLLPLHKLFPTEHNLLDCNCMIRHQRLAFFLTVRAVLLPFLAFPSPSSCAFSPSSLLRRQSGVRSGHCAFTSTVNPSSSRKVPTMGFDCIGIVSKDLKKSVEFYGLLGVEIRQAGGPEHMEGTTESGVRIMLDSHELMKKINENWQPPPAPSGITIGFKQDAPSGVDEVHSAITKAGFETVKEPWDAFWGQRYATVRDPDGNNVDIFANL